MIQTRVGLFETNSSSTHSVSIGLPRVEEKPDFKIPRGGYFKIPEYRVANGLESETIDNILVSEVWKLSFLVNVIATYIVDLEEDSEFLDIFSGLCGRVVDLADKDDQRKAISQDLIYMKWLKDMVFEETGTLIEIPIPEEKKYDHFPYFDQLWTDDGSGGEFYEEIQKSLENGDESKFKSLCREIVFNPSIIIQDKDEAYCCEYIKKVL